LFTGPSPAPDTSMHEAMISFRPASEDHCSSEATEGFVCPGSGHPPVRVSGHPPVRVSGHPPVRGSGHPSVRVSGDAGKQEMT
jgi:hypothetical protein